MERAREEDDHEEYHHHEKKKKKKALTWDDYFKLLLVYKQEHDNDMKNIPVRYTTPSRVKLGQWVMWQRHNLKSYSIIKHHNNSKTDKDEYNMESQATDSHWLCLVRQERSSSPST